MSSISSTTPTLTNPLVYPECAQFTVTGSGTASPPSSALVSFPGAYSSTDPGIAFNIDSDAAKKATSYPIPGPAVWNGAGGGASGPATSSVPPVDTPSPTTMVTSASPVPSAAPTTAPSCEVARYGQCGGKGFGGCTTCANGSKCVANGDYYSQCV
ncbi:Cel1 protein [Pyrenophora tritici-repentis]|nr:Cel1 protein [Pyrenophora tritici-repentis]KAI2483064.1 Cel1 protein [Pyrenophora tritici-repentis]